MNGFRRRGCQALAFELHRSIRCLKRSWARRLKWLCNTFDAIKTQNVILFTPRVTADSINRLRGKRSFRMLFKSILGLRNFKALVSNLSRQPSEFEPLWVTVHVRAAADWQISGDKRMESYRRFESRYFISVPIPRCVAAASFHIVSSLRHVLTHFPRLFVLLKTNCHHRRKWREAWRNADQQIHALDDISLSECSHTCFSKAWETFPNQRKHVTNQESAWHCTVSCNFETRYVISSRKKTIEGASDYTSRVMMSGSPEPAAHCRWSVCVPAARWPWSTPAPSSWGFASAWEKKRDQKNKHFFKYHLLITILHMRKL